VDTSTRAGASPSREAVEAAGGDADEELLRGDLRRTLSESDEALLGRVEFWCFPSRCAFNFFRAKRSFIS
jgi:hypothetical protein